MAKVIEATQRPALILAPNKTLAAQLYGEMKSFFPENAVEYFVSYYDYYQPEAYVPRTDTYIEKEADINEQIDRMRHAATRALLERDDVIIVASVSCIYGIGSGETYEWLVDFGQQSFNSTYPPGTESCYDPATNQPVPNAPGCTAIPEYAAGPTVPADGASQLFPFHNHDDYKATNNGEYPGGMFTMLVPTP
jgi:hypothetical protein